MQACILCCQLLCCDLQAAPLPFEIRSTIHVPILKAIQSNQSWLHHISQVHTAGARGGAGGGARFAAGAGAGAGAAPKPPYKIACQTGEITTV